MWGLQGDNGAEVGTKARPEKVAAKRKVQGGNFG
jgi:hypothetical protein